MNQGFRFNNPKHFQNSIILMLFYSSLRVIKKVILYFIPNCQDFDFYNDYFKKFQIQVFRVNVQSNLSGGTTHGITANVVPWCNGTTVNAIANVVPSANFVENSFPSI
jgi:hypothetical protein